MKIKLFVFLHKYRSSLFIIIFCKESCTRYVNFRNRSVVAGSCRPLPKRPTCPKTRNKIYPRFAKKGKSVTGFNTKCLHFSCNFSRFFVNVLVEKCWNMEKIRSAIEKNLHSGHLSKWFSKTISLSRNFLLLLFIGKCSSLLK